MDLNAAEFKQIVESLRRAVAGLRDAEVRYCLSGSVASWARGGPETVNDVDLIVDPPDMDKAVGSTMRSRSLTVSGPPRAQDATLPLRQYRTSVSRRAAAALRSVSTISRNSAACRSMPADYPSASPI